MDQHLVSSAYAWSEYGALFSRWSRSVVAVVLTIMLAPTSGVDPTNGACLIGGACGVPYRYVYQIDEGFGSALA